MLAVSSIVPGVRGCAMPKYTKAEIKRQVAKKIAAALIRDRELIYRLTAVRDAN